MSLGDNIRNIRKQHNMSQKELAETLHISQQAINKWENDKSFPQIDRLKDISEELSVPEMSVLFDDTEWKYSIFIEDRIDELIQHIKELEEKLELSQREKFDLIISKHFLKNHNGKWIVRFECTEYEYNLYKMMKHDFPDYSIDDFYKFIQGKNISKCRNMIAKFKNNY